MPGSRPEFLNKDSSGEWKGMERTQVGEKVSKRGKGRKLINVGFSSQLWQQMIKPYSCPDTLGACENMPQDCTEGYGS